MQPNEVANGSEGDAYRYTKKVLMGLPNRARLQSIYEEVATKKNISSWTRAAYMDLRTHFFKDGQCKIRFAPGAARIAFGTLSLGTGDEQLTEIGNLHDILRIISIAHSTEYTRHLAPVGGNPLPYHELLAMYGSTVTKDWAALKRKLKRRKYGERKYQIIELDSFETASKYYEYTAPHGWCHLHYKDTFDHYRHVDSSRFTGSTTGLTNMVRLYLAVLPGFETMTVDDELYGESMLGIDIGPGGRLVHVNNRWNHAHDAIDNRKGDNKYDEVELSELLGGPFFELCPPYSISDERAAIKGEIDQVKELNKPIIQLRKRYGRIMDRGTKAGMGEIGEYVDPRDGQKYRTRRIGGVECMLDPIRYIPDTPVYRGILDNELLGKEESPYNREFYMFTMTETGVFVRCQVTFEEFKRVAGNVFIETMEVFNFDHKPFCSKDIEMIFTKQFQVVGRIGEEYRTFRVGISYYALFLTDRKTRYIPFDMLHAYRVNPIAGMDDPDGIVLGPDDTGVTKLNEMFRSMYPDKELPNWDHVEYMVEMIENYDMGYDFDRCDAMELNIPASEWKTNPIVHDSDPITNRMITAFSRSVRAHGKVAGITRIAHLIKSDDEVTPMDIEWINASIPGNNASYDSGKLIIYGSQSIASSLPPGWRTPTLEDMYKILGGLNPENKPEWKVPETYASYFFIDLDGMPVEDVAAEGNTEQKPKAKSKPRRTWVGGASKIPARLTERDRFPRIVIRARLIQELLDAGYSDYIDLLFYDGGRQIFPLFYEHSTCSKNRLENTDNWVELEGGGPRSTILLPYDIDPDGHIGKKRVVPVSFFCPRGAHKFISVDHTSFYEIENMRFVLFPVRD